MKTKRKKKNPLIILVAIIIIGATLGIASVYANNIDPGNVDSESEIIGQKDGPTNIRPIDETDE